MKTIGQLTVVAPGASTLAFSAVARSRRPTYVLRNPPLNLHTLKDPQDAWAPFACSSNAGVPLIAAIFPEAAAAAAHAGASPSTASIRPRLHERGEFAAGRFAEPTIAKLLETV